MSELLHRAFTLTDADVSPDGRTVTGMAVPFGVEAEVADVGPRGVVRYREVFEHGAFDRAVAAPHRVTYVYGHSEGFADRLGYARSFAQTADGLVAEFRLDASRAEQARDALTSTHGGLSIGFASIDPRPYSERDGTLVVRRQVHLAHVAAVPLGAYAMAGISSVREAVDVEADEHRREADADAEAKKAQSEQLLSKIDQMVREQAEWQARVSGQTPAK